jgi:hypothetical protein
MWTIRGHALIDYIIDVRITAVKYRRPAYNDPVGLVYARAISK